MTIPEHAKVDSTPERVDEAAIAGEPNFLALRDTNLDNNHFGERKTGGVQHSLIKCLERLG